MATFANATHRVFSRGTDAPALLPDAILYVERGNHVLSREKICIFLSELHYLNFLLLLLHIYFLFLNTLSWVLGATSI